MAMCGKACVHACPSTSSWFGRWGLPVSSCAKAICGQCVLMLTPVALGAKAMQGDLVHALMTGHAPGPRRRCQEYTGCRCCAPKSDHEMCHHPCSGVAYLQWLSALLAWAVAVGLCFPGLPRRKRFAGCLQLALAPASA